MRLKHVAPGVSLGVICQSLSREVAKEEWSIKDFIEKEMFFFEF
jgi:hypothetical protein